LLRGALSLRLSLLVARDDLYPAIGVRVKRAGAVLLGEREDLLVVGVREDERATQHEAFARFLLFGSGPPVALGEELVNHVGAGVPVRNFDGEAFAAAVAGAPRGLGCVEGVLDESVDDLGVESFEGLGDVVADGWACYRSRTPP
jgi:hypothetical protein